MIIETKKCELKIKDIDSVHKITQALLLNNYDVHSSVVHKQYPYDGIDYFVIEIYEYKEVGENNE